MNDLITTPDTMTSIQIADGLRNNIPDVRSKDRRKGVVYVIKDGDHVKIGRTANLRQRISTVMLTSGRNIKQVAITPLCNNYVNIETQLHRKFSHTRVTGEWFQADFDGVVFEMSTCAFDTTELPPKENRVLKLFELLHMETL